MAYKDTDNAMIFNGVDMMEDETFYVICGAYEDSSTNKYEAFLSHYTQGYALQW